MSGRLFSHPRTALALALFLALAAGVSAGGRTVSRSGDTLEEAGRAVKQLAKQGYVPMTVKGYERRGKLLFDMTFEKRNDLLWETWDFPERAFNKKDQELKKSGFRQVSFSSYTVKGEPWHSAVWHRKR